jgi:hypothetical protein
MGARQFVALGLRLFAIWLFVTALQFYGVMSALRSASAQWITSPWMGALVVVILLAVGVALWMSSGPLARGLMSGLPNVGETKLSAYQALVVGCVLMGLWWLKTSFVPLVILWLRAIAMSDEAGKSAMTWLGIDGKLAALSDVLQVGIGLFFVCRPGKIAGWLLRRGPLVPEASAEPLEVLFRQATELGLRQTVRPDVMAELVERMASHPSILNRFTELEDLLRYEPNPYTRSAAARTIVALGTMATTRARDAAKAQFEREAFPDVAKDLKLLLNASSQSSAPT